MTELRQPGWVPGVMVFPLFAASLVCIAAISTDQASAQPEPFSTLVPLNATFTPPVAGQSAQAPRFEPPDAQDGQFLTISGESVAYTALAGAAFAASGAAY